MATRKPFVCGNWKLHYGIHETRETLREIAAGLAGVGDVEVGIAPVVTTLFAAVDAVKDSKLIIAAQNVHDEQKGAFTGEWSVAHLKELAVTHAIVGHSERRQFFGETDEGVGKKVRALFDGGLVPIACCGELLDEREGGRTMDVVKRQVNAILDGVKAGEVERLVIAYEPVWAIGTGEVATPDDAQEVCAAIRDRIREVHGDAAADGVRILYGGSVKAANVAGIMDKADVDGCLVGGASLDVDEFGGICRFYEMPTL